MSAHLLPIRLYQILEEYSDPEHPLSMGELRHLLQLEYNLTCDRRTVYRGLEALRQAGLDISAFQDSGTGYYLLSRRLEPSEVRLLLDCAVAFPGMGERQYLDLKEKLLRGLSHSQRQACHPLPLPAVYRGMNREVLLAVEVLEEAIAAGRQVSFQYMEYGMDKKLHPRRERPYQVHPYLQLMAGESPLQKTQSLKKLAETRNVPVICVSQVSRLVEERPDHRPVPDDLFWKEGKSGSFSEESMDQILFLYQPTGFQLKDTWVDLYQK